MSSSSNRKRPVRRTHHDDDDDDLDDELDDGAIPEDDDEDWFAHKRRRKPYVPKTDRKSFSHRTISSPYVRPKSGEGNEHHYHSHQTVHRLATTTSTPQSSGTIRQVTTAPVATKPHNQLVTLKPKQTPTIISTQKVMKVVNQNTASSTILNAKGKVNDLSEKLATQSDKLRDSILRKRETLENELKQEIRQELGTTLDEIQEAADSAGGGHAVDDQENDIEMSPTPANKVGGGGGGGATNEHKFNTRKRTTSSFSKRDESYSADDTPGKVNSKMNNSGRNATAASGKKKGSQATNMASSSSGGGGIGGTSQPGSSSKKKEKLYCVCRTPYDNSK